MHPSTWLKQLQEKHGVEECCTAFDCTPEEFAQACADVPAWRYKLTVERNAQARAYFERNKGPVRQGRPCEVLTPAERIALVTMASQEGFLALQQRLNVSDRTLYRAAFGQSVATSNLLLLRSALDNGHV